MSRIEKYRRILEADPGSMVFVELAKALLDEGDPEKAAVVCAQGLAHNPNSIIGRTLLGRALLANGKSAEALVEMERAVQVDPENPFAFNLVADALLAQQLYRAALPYARTALDLQPGDERAAKRLQRIEEALAGATDPALPPPAALRPPAPLSMDVEYALPVAVLDGPAKAGDRITAISTMGQAEPRQKEVATPPAGAAAVGGEGEAAPPAGSPPRDAPSSPRVPREATAPEPPPGGDPAAALRAAVARISSPPQPAPPAPPPLPPRLPKRGPPPLPRKAAEPAPSPAAGPTPEQVEAEARAYEEKLRRELLSVESAPEVGKKTRAALLAVAAVILLAAGTVAFLLARGESKRREVELALTAAENAIAHDTAAKYVAAAAAATRAAELEPDNLEARALGALAEAVLWREHGGGPERRARATALLADPKVAEAAPDVALYAQSLLAEGPAARAMVAAAVADLLAKDAPTVGGASTAARLARLHDLLGRAAFQGGETDRALEHFNKVFAADPSNVRALVFVGERLLDAGDPAQAFESFGAALVAVPDHPRAVAGKARALMMQKKDLARATADVERLLGEPLASRLSPPEGASLRRVRAELWAAQGKAAQAVQDLAEAVKETPDRGDLFATLATIELGRGRADAALEAARTAVRKEDIPAHRLALARAELRLDRARAALETLGALPAGHLDARLLRGIAQYGLGRYEAARAELEGTKVGAGYLPEAALYLALVDLALGETRRAAPVLNRLASVQPPWALAMWGLGQIALAEGKEPQARQWFQKAADADPFAPEGLLALGKMELDAWRPQAALAPLLKAVERAPGHTEPRLLLARAQLELGGVEEARAALDPLVEGWVDPAPTQTPPGAGGAGSSADVRALALMAEVRAAAGQGELARALAQKAIAADGKSPLGHQAAGRVALALHDGRSALKSIRKAAGLAGKDPAIQTDLGLALLAVGDAAGARRAFEEALKAAPGWLPAQVGLGRALTAACKHDDAIRALEKAARALANGAPPRLAEARAALALALLGKGKDKLAAAARAARDAVEAYDKSAAAHHAAAKVAEADKRPDDALAAYTRAALLDPGWAEPRKAAEQLKRKQK